MRPRARVTGELNLGTEVGEPSEIAAADSSLILCTYRATDLAVAPVVVRFTTNSDAARFAQRKKVIEESGKQPIDIVGFQDEAYATTPGPAGPETTVVARKGSIEIMVISSVASADERGPDSKALRDPRPTTGDGPVPSHDHAPTTWPTLRQRQPPAASIFRTIPRGLTLATNRAGTPDR